MTAPVRFTPIPRERVPFDWEQLLRHIGKAIAHDEGASPHNVYRWLETGFSKAEWVATGLTKGAVVTTIAALESEPIFWLNYAGGHVAGGPRAFISDVRSIVTALEYRAESAGCTEIRIGGRDWSRAFPEWERFDPSYPNRIRKRL